MSEATWSRRLCAELGSRDPADPAVDPRLLELDNTVLTPHIGYVTREVYEIFYRDAVEDIAAFQSGNPIRVME